MITNTLHINIWNATIAVVREKCTALDACVPKELRLKVNELSIQQIRWLIWNERCPEKQIIKIDSRIEILNRAITRKWISNLKFFLQRKAQFSMASLINSIKHFKNKWYQYSINFSRKQRNTSKFIIWGQYHTHISKAKVCLCLCLSLSHTYTKYRLISLMTINTKILKKY